MFPKRERSKPEFKPKFGRIKRLLAKREPQRQLDWFTSADAAHNVHVHPTNLK